MGVFVPILLTKVEDRELWKGSFPFYKKFEYQDPSREKVIETLHNEIAGLLWKSKDKKLLALLESYKDKKGYDYIYIDLFSGGEHLFFASGFLKGILFYFSLLAAVITFVIYCFHPSGSYSLLEEANRAIFREESLYSVAAAIGIFLILWGWLFNKPYKVFMNFYEINMLRFEKWHKLHKRFITRFFCLSSSSLNLDEVQYENE